MEHNDVTVVIYRILSELYQSKKNGETAKEQTMTARRLGIPESYRSDVIKWLIGKGYIMKRWSPEENNEDNEVTEITVDGMMYIHENENMRRLYEQNEWEWLGRKRMEKYLQTAQNGLLTEVFR